MPVTYDVELNEVGVGSNVVTGITTASYSLTGLKASSDYQVRVRQVNTVSGAAYVSLWSAWVDFTTLALQVPIVASFGTITNDQTLHSITTSVVIPDVIVTTYDVELTEDGQSPVVTTDVSGTSHTFTGLTASTDYSVRVRQVKTVNGGKYTSLWSDPVAFTAGVALPDPVVAVFGSITNDQTLHSITTSVSAAPPDIVATFGSITNDQTLHPITTFRPEPASPIVASFGSISNDQTLHPITTSIAVPVAPTHWVVTVTDLFTSTVVDEAVVTQASYSITGLSAKLVGGNTYRLSVIGISNLGAKSQAATVDFTTVMPSVSDSIGIVTSTEQALDQFYINVTELYDDVDNIALLFGNVNQAFDTITGTFDSAPYTITADGLQFTGETLDTDPVAVPAHVATYVGDVEVAATDYTGASTTPASITTTLTVEDLATNDYYKNNPGKVSFQIATGSGAATQYHHENNCEILMPDNASKADVQAKVTMSRDGTLSLIKNGDYANPLTTVSSTIEPDATNGSIDRYVCNITMSDIPVSGGDHLEISMNQFTYDELSPLLLARDPSKTFFTATVTEVYV